MRAAVALNPEHRLEATSLPILAKYLMLSRAEGEPLPDILTRYDAPDRVKRIVKAAVDVGTISGWGSSIVPEIATAQSAYVETLRTGSVFFNLLGRGALRRIPLRTKVTSITAGATAYARGEGSARAATKFELDSSAGLSPLEAVGLLIVSADLLKHPSPAAQALFNRELNGAVSAVVDDQFMTIVAAAKASSIASLGTTFNAAREDLKDMLAAISVDASSELFWIGGTGVAKAATLLAENGVWTFPDVGPMGGTLRNRPFLVTDQIATDSLYLVDANKIAGNSDDIVFDMLQEGDVQMDDAPDSPATASTTMISLWQRNLVALLARAHFAAEVVTATAVVELTSVAWGSYSPDSPT